MEPDDTSLRRGLFKELADDTKRILSWRQKISINTEPQVLAYGRTSSACSGANATLRTSPSLCTA